MKRAPAEGSGDCSQGREGGRMGDSHAAGHTASQSKVTGRGGTSMGTKNCIIIIGADMGFRKGDSPGNVSFPLYS